MDSERYCHTMLTHPPQERSEPLRQDSGAKLLSRGDSVSEHAEQISQTHPETESEYEEKRH